MENRITYAELTLDDVKAAIGFDKSGNVGRALAGMVDCWYAIKLPEGHEVAIKYALDMLGAEVIKWGDKVTNHGQ